MVTVTRDTLGNSSITFIRDVLRENLTDTQSPSRTGSQWIFKSEPEGREFDPPHVILDETARTTSTVAQGRKRLPTSLTFDIIVWTRSISDRDTVADEIIKTLSDRTNTDGTNSISSQSLLLDSYDMLNDDIDIGEAKPKLVRVKEISITFRYTGN